METTEMTAPETNLSTENTQENGGGQIEKEVQSEGQEKVTDTGIVDVPEGETPESPSEQSKETEDPEFVLKVDGQEVKLSKKEAIEKLQKGLAAEKRLEQASKVLREAEQKEIWIKQEFQQILENPAILFNDPVVGKKFREFAEQQILEEIEEANLSPVERELKQAKRELEKVKTEKERIAKAEQEKYQQEKEQEYFNYYHTEIKKAIEKGGFPTDRETMAELVPQFARAIKQNPGKTFDEIAGIVKNSILKLAPNYIKLMEPENLRKFLPEDYLSKLVKVEAKQFKPVVVNKNLEENSSLSEADFNKKYGL